MQDRYGRNSRRSSMLLLCVTVTVINFFAVIVAAKSTAFAIKLTAVVNTTTGPVQGKIHTSVNSVNYAAFKGIPYAKPPLGYLRFKPPVAIDPWIDTLDATVERDDCIQIDLNTHDVVGSEDCLSISVYTPVADLSKTPTTLKAVMVWIYGGGFNTGTSSSATYNPEYLLEKDVVYVALNYRLGALGFLSLSHPNATGNAGLKDQVLALKWVQKNIEKFGGNPNNVTIFGQSAGAASVGYHILSDASTGLFQGAISMSGVPLNPWAFHTPVDALFRGYQLGASLGTISTDKNILLRTFYYATADKIVEASSQISLGVVPFVPTVEDIRIATEPFLTQCSIIKYNNGNFTKVPQLLGFTDHETVGLVRFAQPLIDIINNATANLQFPLDKLNDTTIQALIDKTSELVFISQIDETQQIFSDKNNGKSVYYYHFSFNTNTSLHNLKLNNNVLGAGHGDDLAYVFYHPEAHYSNDHTDPTRLTIDRVSTMWTNFAKYGNPTPSWVHDDFVNITWPNSERLGRSLNIGTELKVELRPTNYRTKLGQAASSFVRSIVGC